MDDQWSLTMKVMMIYSTSNCDKDDIESEDWQWWQCPKSWPKGKAVRSSSKKHIFNHDYDDDDDDDDDHVRAKRGGLKHVSPTHAETYAGILQATL